MLINFFLTLRRYKVPATIRELMDLIAALDKRVVYSNVDDFYLLSRTAMVKDEKNYDKFDRAFSAYFKGLEDLHGLLESLIPDEWLRREFERALTPEELEQIKSLGGLEKLIEAFRKAREKAEAEEGQDQDGQEGNADRPGRRRYRWSRPRQEEKGQEGLGPASIQEPRRFGGDRHPQHQDGAAAPTQVSRARGKKRNWTWTTRSGPPPTNGGMLDIRLRPQRRNTVKVLLLLDIGGSMDAHVKICEELFSATRTEFKHLESYYFHNFIYESVWKDNRRRMNERIPTWQLLNKYARDYKGRVRGGCHDGTLRDHPRRRQRRALERRAGRVVDEPLHGILRQAGLDQPDPSRDLGLLLVGRHDPRTG